VAASLPSPSTLPPPRNDALVSFQAVTKRYWNLAALDGVTFDLRRGEIFGYIGPNGAGKTTTIKILVGLITVFEGSVSLGGITARESPDAVHRMLGYLPQKAAFQDWRTVDQALVTFGKLSGLSSSELVTRIPEVLGLLGIRETRHRRIAQLSGGTVQKVGMAQAILHRPPLLVLDEPMAGLDPASRHEFKELFRTMRSEGTTIFFSSHILSDVQDVADRIGILNRGRILHVGTFDELRARLRIPKDVEILLAHDSGRALAPGVLQRLTGIETVGPGRLVAHVRSECDLDDTVNALIDGFRGAEYRLRGIRPIVPDLEELYLRFVGGASA
jgi:ABC-2 type transport system ATP-binding protein